MTTAAGVIELVCDADRPLGRNVITIGEIVELHLKAEKEKSTKVAKAEGGNRRREVLWINPVAVNQMEQQTIFSLPGVQLGLFNKMLIM